MTFAKRKCRLKDSQFWKNKTEKRKNINEETGKQNIRWNTMKILAVGFLSVIFLGAVLLWLPVSNEKSIKFSGCAFYINIIGMCDGIGYNCSQIPIYNYRKSNFADFNSDWRIGRDCMYYRIFMLLKRKITVKERVVIQEAYNMNSLGGLVGLVRKF